ncbi:MAG TPA: hypothetical protein VIY69_05860, partial [Candidatus Acidoferrales bacterium]
MSLPDLFATRRAGITAMGCCLSIFLIAALLCFPQQLVDAPTGYDNQTNGLVDQKTHASDQVAFDRVLGVDDGLGPLYNGQSCRECHENPTSGGASQISALRVGHLDAQGHFQDPEIPVARGEQIIKGRSLVNDRSICPNINSPNTDVQEHVPDTETIRA